MLNIIFDLDETLIDSYKLIDDNTNLIKTDRRISEVFYMDTNIEQFFVVCRAYSSLLLRYCFKNFKVGFWTAGTIKYGDIIIKKILSEEEYKKCICIIGRTKSTYKIWECKDIVNGNILTIPKLDNVQTKPLSYLFNDNKNYKTLNKNNTILIDNSPWNIIPNPNNSIYVIDSCSHKSDKILFKLYEFLKDIKDKKIKSVKDIDFQKSFNSQYKEQSCIDLKSAGLINTKKEYDIGDCVELYESIHKNNYYIIIKKLKSKQAKSKRKKSNGGSRAIKYMALHLYNIEDKTFNQDNIAHQVFI